MNRCVFLIQIFFFQIGLFFSQDPIPITPTVLNVEWNFDEIYQDSPTNFKGTQDQDPFEDPRHSVYYPLFQPLDAQFGPGILPTPATAISCPVSEDGLVSGVSGCGANGDYAIAAKNWNTLTLDDEKYFEFTIDFNDGVSSVFDIQEVSIETVSFHYKNSSTGPSELQLKYEIVLNSGAVLPEELAGNPIQIEDQNWHHFSAVLQISMNDNAENILEVADYIRFRLYGYNNTQNRGTLRIDNFSLLVTDVFVLPFKITQMGVEALSHGNTLEWSIAGDDAGSTYSIYRSADGINWRDIDKIKALAQSKYTYTDYTPTHWQSYYKICAGSGGKESCSQTVLAQNEWINYIFYDVASKQLVIGPDGGDLYIFSIDGKSMISKQNVQPYEQVDLQNIPHGFYFAKCGNKIISFYVQ